MAKGINLQGISKMVQRYHKNERLIFYRNYSLLSIKQLINKPMSEADKEKILCQTLNKQLQAQSEAMKMVSCLLLEQQKPNRFFASIDRRVKIAIERICQQPDSEASTVQALAQINHISSSRLIYLFKEETAVSIGRLKLWVKLINALKSIVHGQKFAEASKLAGFVDQAHFSKSCKTILGLTPSALLLLPVKVVKL